MPERRPAGRLQSIAVVGADANNLKSVEVEFPLGAITVVTGVSGSGKSSLLVDTLAAEGSRRTHTFLGLSQRELEREDVAAFVGTTPPTILVGQRGFRASIRTTVGTATGFLAVLRKLFLLGSAPWSDRLGDMVPEPSPEAYGEWLARHYRGTAEVWAAPVRQKKINGAAAVARLARHGVTSLRVYSESDSPRLGGQGRELGIEAFRPLNPNLAHTIEAMIASVNVTGPASRAELQAALDLAFAAGDGSIVVMLPEADDPALEGPFGPRLDSVRHRVHPRSPEVFNPPSAHLLSFNAPSHEESGACRDCAGTGVARRLRLDALVSSPEKSMRAGAFSLWTAKNFKHVNIQHETINGLEGMAGFSPDVPWRELPASARTLILEGAGDELVQDRDGFGRKFGQPRRFRGFRPVIVEKAAGQSRTAAQLAHLVEEGRCEACDGTRWSPQARALRIAGLGVADLLGKSFAELEEIAAPGARLAKAVPAPLRGLVKALREHSVALGLVGLGYLTGDRGMLDVSGGESRRIRLARVLEAGEGGLCLLFDEPARGLHEADLPPLGAALQRLRGRHTVILNEHRERLWGLADRFIEIGPGAGSAGGEIVSAGKPRPISDSPIAPRRSALPVRESDSRLRITGATIHNIKGVDCAIPLGRLTCICGVSGSGKSSFVRGILVPAASRAEGGTEAFETHRDGSWRSLSGFGGIRSTVALDQRMPPPNRRSLIATAADLFDPMRRVFGASPGAIKEGLAPSDFGINAGKGRCRICLGLGEIEDDGVESPCPACGGGRFGPDVLAVRIAGFNIAELLETPAHLLAPMAEVFRIPPLFLSALCGVGLGYLALGRRVDSLSGGELQRLRLAIRLASSRDASSLVILDEPAAGLHRHDVGAVIGALDAALDAGRNTVVVVDHDLDLIRQSDWVMEFGPGGGPDGGCLVFEGTPKDLARARTATGLALQGKLPAFRRGAVSSGPGPEAAHLSPRHSAERTSALLRTLLTGDLPAEALPEQGCAQPIVLIDDHFWQGRDPWEVAGLDLELPKLLLDLECARREDSQDQLIAAWASTKEAWLSVQPYLTELGVWGTDIPRSVRSAVAERVAKEGLQLVDIGGSRAESALDPSRVRATGPRFEPSDRTDAACRAAVRDALAIGGGYVELRANDGALMALAGNRIVDLDRALVAPMKPVPADFSRHHRRGRCPACLGSRTVTCIEDSLIIADSGLPPHEASFLTREAEAVTRGVRRNLLMPFLRRLEKEGLWDMSVPFRRLDDSQKALILHGCWARPGPGTFLKGPKADPSEVASWLRWDGLYRALLEEAARSTSRQWRQSLGESARQIPCPTCGGTGLRAFASLLMLGERTFADWAGDRDGRRKYAALQSLRPLSPRQRETHRRLLECLAPLGHEGSPKEIFERAVHGFTTMKSADAPQA